MSGFWKLITSSHHPVVVAGLILVLAIFGVRAGLDAATFALKIVTFAVDDLADRVGEVRESAAQAVRAVRRLRRRVVDGQGSPRNRSATLVGDGEGTSPPGRKEGH